METQMDGTISVFGAVCLLLVGVLIAKSPKFLQMLYLIWFLCLSLTIQITYNHNLIPSDLQSSVFTAEDNQHKKVTCKIQMLNTKYSWKLKSEDIVQMNGKDISIQSILNSQELIDELSSVKYIFCLGNSSHEGEQSEEESRASRRAQNFAKWLKELLPELESKIRLLDLGMNTQLKSGSSAQRRLILIAILQCDPQVNMKQALQNGLQVHNILPFNIKDYSKFDLK